MLKQLKISPKISPNTNRNTHKYHKYTWISEKIKKIIPNNSKIIQISAENVNAMRPIHTQFLIVTHILVK